MQSHTQPGQATPAVAGQSIQPAPGESYEDYVVRAHLALMQQMPEPAERNAAVWGLWERANGDDERQRAAAKFNDEAFVLRPMVPLFVEHEKVGQDARGQETVTNYDVAELKNIIRENNFRIADTDAYTGLVDKHTVPGGMRDPMPPKTLGYVGPYRLGMLGRKHPRFAIFADEHHRKDRAEQLADRPRRSVEVLRLAANGRRYIDPIAALAEAPRLPLPVATYSASGTICERYAAVMDPGFDSFGVDRYEGGAFPGGANTFVKGPIQTKKTRTRYGSGADKNAAGVGKAPETEPAMLNDNRNPDGMVRQVIDALQSTEEWQALRDLVDMMKQQQAEEEAAPMGDPMMDDPLGEAGEMPSPEMAPDGASDAASDLLGTAADAGPQALAGQSAAGRMPLEDPGLEDPTPVAEGDIVMDEQEPDQAAAPLIAGAARIGAGLARNPAVQRAAGNMAAGALSRVAENKQQDRNGVLDKALSALGGAAEGPLRQSNAGNRQMMSARYAGTANGYHRYSTDPEPTRDEMANAERPSGDNVERYQAEIDQYQAEIADRDATISRLEGELAEVTSHNNSILTEQAEHYAALHAKVADMELEKEDATRKQRIQELAQRFPVVNVERECERCLYSAGNEMSTEQFELHLDTVETYAAEAAVATPMVPVGVEAATRGPGSVESARYAADTADRAMHIVNQAIRRGERISYDEALEKAKTS